MGTIRNKAYARVGLLGNPSDGYRGKVISFALQNFFAEVSLEPHESIVFTPNLDGDGHLHATMSSLADTTHEAGYTGGVQLLMATCSVFYRRCQAAGVALPDGKGFQMAYSSNIPRQCGMSGSSAIVLACLKCLQQHYNIRIQAQVLPQIAIEAEEDELGITAGLQDRLIQTYGGLVFMDFSQVTNPRQDVPRLQRLDASKLPELFVTYCKNPTSSGKVHSNIRSRWQNGDSDVQSAMTQFASFAEQGRTVIEDGDAVQLASLLDQNFAERRKLLGDQALGQANIRMAEIVTSLGGSAKLTGSGGALVALFAQGCEQERKTAIGKAKQICKTEGFEMVEAHIAPAQAEINHNELDCSISSVSGNSL